MNRKYALSASLAAVFALATCGLARADTIEVGGASDASSAPLEAVIHVVYSGAHAGGFYLLALFRAQMAEGSAPGTRYVDYEFTPIKEERGATPVVSWFNDLAQAIQKNIVIDNDFFMNLSFLGFRGDAQAHVGNVEMYLKGALDLAALSLNGTIGAPRPGVDVEIGATFDQRFRVSIGQRAAPMAGAAPVPLAASTQSEAYEKRGDFLTHFCGSDSVNCSRQDNFIPECKQVFQVFGADDRANSATSLSLVYGISEHFSVFGTADLNIYSLDQQVGTRTADGAATWALQYFVGAVGSW